MKHHAQPRTWTTTIKDLYNDSDPLQLDGFSFMFGLGLVGYNGFYGFDETYVKISMTYVKGTFISNKSSCHFLN